MTPIRWTGWSLHPRHRSVCAVLPDGSDVAFHETASTSPLCGPHWRAVHRGRIVGGFEFRAGADVAFANWLDRIARVAATKGPASARELGWYA